MSEKAPVAAAINGPRPNTLSPLVLGDWVIDDSWVLGEQASATCTVVANITIGACIMREWPPRVFAGPVGQRPSCRSPNESQLFLKQREPFTALAFGRIARLRTICIECLLPTKCLEAIAIASSRISRRSALALWLYCVARTVRLPFQM